MSTETWSIYVGTVLVLMSTPGPSQLLMVSNSLSSGFHRSLMTAAGDLSANLIQMSIATLGLAYLIQSNERLIIFIQWLGVGYLLYLGINSLVKQQHMVADTGPAPTRSKSSLYFQGFVVSAVNPKAVVFFAALFPQFINPAAPVFPQFAALSATYLLMDGTFLIVYAAIASKLADHLADSASLVFRRGPGVLLIIIALVMAMRTV